MINTVPPLTMPPTSPADTQRATRDLYTSIQQFYPTLAKGINDVASGAITNLDGGRADTVYTTTQKIDCGAV